MKRKSILENKFVVIFLFCFFVWFCAYDIDWTKLTSFSWSGFSTTFAQLLEPDFSILYNGSGEDVLSLMVVTVGIAFVGTTIGTILCIPFVLFASKNLWNRNKIVPAVGKFVLDILRAFPELVYAIIFIKVVGPGPFAGALAIGVHQIGMLGKLFTEEMEMMNQVAFFSSNFVQMKKVREYMPKAPAGVFIHTALTGNVSDYEKLQLQTTLYNYQTSHEFSNIDSDLDYAYKLSARGMTSFIHTVNLETNFDDFVYNSGVDCLLTDYPEWGNKYIYNISAITSNVELGTPFTPKAKVNGTYKVVTCGIENVDGTAIEVDGDGKYCLLEEIEVVYYYDFSKIVNYGTYKEEIKYRLYSQPVVIK